MLKISATGSLAAVSGCLNGSDNTDSDNTSNNEQSSIFVEVNTTSLGSYGSSVGLSIKLDNENNAEAIGLYSSEGSQEAFTNLGPEETLIQLGDFSSSNPLSNETYEIVAFDSEGNSIDRIDWAPNVEYSIEDVTAAGLYAARKVRFVAKNKGDIPINIENVYISDGHPSGDDFGTIRNSVEVIPIVGEREFELRTEDYSSNVILPKNETCDSQTQTLEITIESDVGADKILEVKLTLGGDYIDGSRGIGCTDVVVSAWEEIQ